MAEHAQDQDEDQGLLARWRQAEPLRLWLYGVAAPLLAVLVADGLLTEHKAGLWLAVLTAALLGGGVEVARQYVVAPATARSAVALAVQEAQRNEWTRDEDVERYVRLHYRIPS